MAEPTLLDKLRSTRQTKIDEWGKLIDARETERGAFETRAASDTKPTDADVEAFRAAEVAYKETSDGMEADIRALDERVRVQEDVVARRAAAAAADIIQDLHVAEPLTYRQDNQGDHSYFRDMAVKFDRQAASRIQNSEGVQERLQRHAQEMDVEMPKVAAEKQRRANAQIEKAEVEFRGSFYGGARRGLNSSPFERRVNPNRTDGQGGYFVPPMWLPDYIAGLRAGRVAAGLARQMDLPPGTDSINLPKLSTLTQTAVQGSDGGAVDSVDYTDTLVTATVKTLAGQEDVAIQLLDQSPYHLDQVIMEDLTADYNRLVDRQVIYGAGVNSAALNGGSILGIYPAANWSGTNTITATEASPNGTYFPQVLGAMASQIAWNRYDLSNLAYVLHPRRWFWYATSLDSTGRPLVESSDFSPFNPGMINVNSVPAEGLAGRTPFGPDVYIDANVPTTDNGSGSLTGTNDVAIAAKWDDVWLFEGEMRTRVLPEVLSGTLEVRFQVYNYVAFLVRYGQSLAIAEGTYFAAPVGQTSNALVF